MIEELRLWVSFGALLISTVAFVWTVFIYLSARSKATREELRELSDRLIKAESEIKGKPTADALHELALAISDIGGDLKALMARTDGVEKVAERLEKVADRQESYLLDKATSK